MHSKVVVSRVEQTRKRHKTSPSYKTRADTGLQIRYYMDHPFTPSPRPRPNQDRWDEGHRGTLSAVAPVAFRRRRLLVVGVCFELGFSSFLIPVFLDVVAAMLLLFLPIGFFLDHPSSSRMICRMSSLSSGSSAAICLSRGQPSSELRLRISSSSIRSPFLRLSSSSWSRWWGSSWYSSSASFLRFAADATQASVRLGNTSSPPSESTERCCQGLS